MTRHFGTLTSVDGRFVGSISGPYINVAYADAPSKAVETIHVESRLDWVGKDNRRRLGGADLTLDDYASIFERWLSEDGAADLIANEADYRSA